MKVTRNQLDALSEEAELVLQHVSVWTVSLGTHSSGVVKL